MNAPPRGCVAVYNLGDADSVAPVEVMAQTVLRRLAPVLCSWLLAAGINDDITRLQ